MLSRSRQTCTCNERRPRPIEPGGTAKTRVALQVAGDLKSEFPDGVYFVDLAPISIHSGTGPGHVVGDAKYFTRVGGVGLPPAKFSIIAEHVWLLEKTGAPTTFLVFGNDRQVPIRWLERYGDLTRVWNNAATQDVKGLPVL
jgi:hypothetical protein